MKAQICDQCEKVGKGIDPRGWWHVQSDRDMGEVTFDFCSKNCVVAHFESPPALEKP